MERIGSIALLLAVSTACGPVRVVFPTDEDAPAPDEPDTPTTVDTTDDTRGANVVIEPASLDLGTPAIGCTHTETVELVNHGDLTAYITDLSAVGHHAISVRSHELPLAIGPGDSVRVGVDFTPSSAITAEAVLRATLSDGSTTPAALVTGSGGDDRAIVDTYITPTVPTDILFMVDSSPSMYMKNLQLQTKAEVLLHALQSWIPDWRLAVIDASSGCVVTDVITPETSNPVQSFADALARVSYQTSAPYADRLLDLTHRALTMTGPGACNADLTRPDALLHAVLFTDRDDRSGQSPSGAVQDVRAQLAEPDLLRISAIAGPVPSGCEGADPAYAYNEAVELTLGTTLSSCGAMDDLPELAQVSSPSLTVPLTYPAEPGSILVYIAGRPASPTLWQYDAELQSVTFDVGPAAGAIIDIEYLAATCP